MRYQLLFDASSDVLDMSSVSALVSGMRASRLECSASQRKGMFVMQCALPEVVKKSEDPEHACDPRASAVLVYRASRYAKQLLDAASVSADTQRLASVLFQIQWHLPLPEKRRSSTRNAQSARTVHPAGTDLTGAPSSPRDRGGKRRIAKQTAENSGVTLADKKVAWQVVHQP
jgi:hypothetical protein